MLRFAACLLLTILVTFAGARSVMAGEMRGPAKGDASGKLNASQLRGTRPKLSADRELWGYLATLVDNYWIETDGRARLWVYYKWEEPWVVLAYSGLDAGGNPVAGRFKLDQATKKISSFTVYRGTATQADVELVDSGFVESGLTGSASVRETYQRVRPGEFEVRLDTYRKGDWKLGKPLRYIQVSQELVASLGWTPISPAERPKSFWAGLGDAMKQGAKDGLAEGVRDGVHDRTQGAIAGKYTQPKAVSTPQPQ